MDRHGMHLHVEEWANRNMVTVRLHLGPDRAQARSAGSVVMRLSYWLKLSRALEVALGKDFSRGPCQHGCGHESHIADVCVAGIFTAEGLPAPCGCEDDRAGVI